MVTGDDLNKLAVIIDSCRELVERVSIKINIDLSYVLCALYSKALLTMCEIHCILLNGYPEGAMALARNIYETLVIMAYLHSNQHDQQLIERFTDDFSIKTCHDHIKYLNWYRSNDKDDSYIRDELSKRQDEWSNWLNKYDSYVIQGKSEPYLNQYWWAGKDMSFNKIRKETSYDASYMYDLSCYRVHAGMTGIIYFDNTEEGFLIGATDNGKEFPMFFSLLNFTIQTRLYFDYHNVDCAMIFTQMDSLLKEINKYMLSIDKERIV